MACTCIHTYTLLVMLHSVIIINFVVYTVPTNQSEVTILQSDESQQGQDDGERRQVENTNGLL